MTFLTPKLQRNLAIFPPSGFMLSLFDFEIVDPFGVYLLYSVKQIQNLSFSGGYEMVPQNIYLKNQLYLH